MSSHDSRSFCVSFFFIYQRIHWLISAVCNLPRWLEVYSKWALVSTSALVLLNGVRLPCMFHSVTLTLRHPQGLAVGFLVDDSGSGVIRIAVETSNIVMLMLICIHFVICIPVSVHHAQLHFESGAGKTVGAKGFDPSSKLLGVRQATFVLCVSMLLRSILIIMSLTGLIKAFLNQTISNCGTFCGECQPDVVLISRIIDNE